MRKQVIETLENRVLLSGSTSVYLTTEVPWNGQNVTAVFNSYIAQLKKGDLASVANKLHLPVTEISDLGDGFYKFSASVSSKVVSTWATKYASYFSALSPNAIVTKQATRPNDGRYGEQWHLSNVGQTVEDPSDGFVKDGTDGSDIDAEKAWDISVGDTQGDIRKQIIVAVLDTGIDLTHPDLVDNIFTNPDEVPGDNVDNDGNGYIDDVHGWNSFANSGNSQDDDGHGTHVSGIIGAKGNNGIGVAGVNWNVKILPVKALGTEGGTTESVIGGIRYITRLKDQGYNVVVVNASLGGSEFPFNEAESRAVEQLGDRKVLMVVAAGNDGVDNDRNIDFPAKYSLNLPNVITVAATDATDTLAYFSNYGATSVQVAAPGVGILSTGIEDTPDLVDNDGDGEIDEAFETYISTYVSQSGTSMASPVVAGIVALAKSVKPDATMDELRRAVVDSTDPIDSLNVQNSLPRLVSTAGRVNAYRALAYIQNQFVEENTIRQGNWVGAYGAQGAYIVGESTSFPSFVNAQITGDSTQVDVAASTRKANGLQRLSDSSDRLIAYRATTTTETIDLNFTDGLAHRVGIYMADFDGRARTQEVRLVDVNSGVVTDFRTVSKFKNGKYLFWDVKGHVQIQVIKTAGQKAVFSGIFFDAVPTEDQILYNTDTTTRGAWSTKYGSQGAIVVGQNDTTFASSIVDYAFTGATKQVFRTDSADKIAPHFTTNQLRSPVAVLKAADNNSFEVHLNFLVGQTQRTSFYFYDVRNQRRQMKVEVIDTNSGTLLNRTDVNTFAKGKYLTYDLTGSVTIRITRLAGPNPVLSGIFFDATPAAQVQFVGVDSTTRGNWRLNGRYGTNGQFVAGLEDVNQFNDSEIDYVISDPNSIDATEAEPNDSTQTANPIAPFAETKSISGVIDAAQAEDFYTFVTRQTGVFGDSVSLNFTNLEGDLNLEVYDTSGDKVGESISTTDTESVSLAGLEEGRYYIRVFGADNATNDYTLTFSLQGGAATTATLPTTVIAQHTTNRSAPQNPLNARDRIAAHFTASSEITFDLELTDNRTHRVALYAADYERLGRVEQVQILSADGSTVLASHRLENFRGGKYLVWNIRGKVQIKITTLTTQNPVFSAIFFD